MVTSITIEKKKLKEKTYRFLIEEGSIQKARQTVVVLDWGARSNAALGNFGVKV